MSYVRTFTTNNILNLTDEQLAVVITDSRTECELARVAKVARDEGEYLLSEKHYSSTLARFLYRHAMLALMIDSQAFES